MGCGDCTELVKMESTEKTLKEQLYHRNITSILTESPDRALLVHELLATYHQKHPATCSEIGPNAAWKVDIRNILTEGNCFKLQTKVWGKLSKQVWGQKKWTIGPQPCLDCRQVTEKCHSETETFSKDREDEIKLRLQASEGSNQGPIGEKRKVHQ